MTPREAALEREVAKLKEAHNRAFTEVLRLADELRRRDPSWGAPMHLNDAATLSDEGPTPAEVREAVKQALVASAYKHIGDDSYSQGMDRGARHQLERCLEAVERIEWMPLLPARTLSEEEIREIASKAHERCQATCVWAIREALRRTGR